jgi:hypothetical protein
MNKSNWISVGKSKFHAGPVPASPFRANNFEIAGQAREQRNTFSLISILATVIALSCQPEKEITYKDQELIKGNASPILFMAGVNEINLEDYVLDLSKLDSVTAPTELKQTRKNNVLFLEGELSSWLSDLNLWQQGQAYCVPLQKANKSKITITYSGPAKDVKSKGRV